MKAITTLLLAISLLGCGSEPSSDLKQLGTQGVVYSFAADYRPVDGNYVRVTIYSPDQSRYSVVRTTISARGGIKKEEVIVRNISCKISNADSKKIRILCKRDRRPVDGKMQVVAIVPSRYGSGDAVDAVYYENFYDRINGKPVKSKKALGTKLKRIK